MDFHSGGVALFPLKNWSIFPLVISENYETILRFPLVHCQEALS